jgi:apolipoprotein N-acyltransferase
VSDILGALFFSLYTWNSNVELTTTFGFGFTGYSLAYHQLLRPLAAFGGVYALTFSLTAIALCTILLRQYLAAHKRDYALVVVCAVFIGTAYLPWYNTTPHEGIAVAALQSRFEARTYFSDYEMSLRKQELRNAIKFALSENVEVIALPEDSRLGYGVPNIVSQLQYEAVGSAPIIVDSYRTMTSSTSVVQRAYLYDLKTGATYTTDKSALVPMGEFIPVLHALVLRALHGTSFFKDMYYVPGAHEIPGTAPPTVPHVLFCFEGGAAHIAKRKTLMRASSLIVHPVSHAWFHKPHTLWHQTRSMLIVQSIYTGVPILQSGNMAPSLLYTPDGGVHTGTSTKTSSRVTLHTFVI